MNLKRFTMLAVLAFVMLSNLPFYMPCPVDDLDSRWTGAYAYVDGVRFAVYQCPRLHRFKVRCPVGCTPGN